MEPHTPSVLTTIQIPCGWKDVPLRTPVFDAYMETLSDGDKKVQQLLLEFMGACISNVKGWRMKKALFLVGGWGYREITVKKPCGTSARQGEFHRH